METNSLRVPPLLLLLLDCEDDMKKAIAFLVAIIGVVFASDLYAQYVYPNKGQVYNSAKTGTKYGIVAENGLAAAADSAIALMPDTTFSATTTPGGTAFREIWIDLDDQAICWDLAKFRQLEKLKSWYPGAGPFPTRSAIRITGGQDSLLIIDRQKGTTWMVFRPSGADFMLYEAAPFTGFVFKDLKLYLGLTGAGVEVIDFVADKAFRYATNGLLAFTGNIGARNSTGIWFVLNSSPSIINNTVSAVDVVRDPLGSVDEFGRTKHRMSVTTAGGVSVSDAGVVNIYDATDTSPYVAVSLSSDGTLAAVANYTYDYLELGKRIQTISGDGFALGRGGLTSWRNLGDGSQKIPFADAVVFNEVKTFPNASIAGPSETFLVSTSAGLIFSNTNSGTETSGLTLTIDATRSAPPWSAVADSLGWNSQSLLDSSNVWGKTLTPVATPTWGTGVIGQSATLNGTTQYFFRRNDHSFRIGNGSSFALCVWTKSTSASNPAGLQYVSELGTTTASVQIYFNTSGQLVSRTSDDRSNWDTSTYAVDIYDATWHFICYSGNGTSFKQYVDGELVNTTAYSSVNSALAVDTLTVGTNTGASLFFAGSVLPWQKVSRALSASEIRWLYYQGVHGQQSNIDPNDAADTAYVAGIATDPRSRFFATWGSGNGTRDSVTVWDQFGIPKWRYGSPGGNIKTVALISSPGGDSLSIGIGTSTKIQWRQTDLRISELAGYQRPTYPDHDGWARHVTTPRDSGTWVEGAVAISSSDSLARFKYTDPNNPGDFRVGRNAEIRGGLRYGSASAVAADIAELLSGGPAIWKTTAMIRPSSGESISIPPFMRLDSLIVVRDNDSTRTYAFTIDYRTDPVKNTIIFGDWLRKGKSGSTVSDTVKVLGVEVGDTLACNDITIAKRTVISVDGDVVRLSGTIPADKKFKVYPPNLKVKYTTCNVSVGDVVVLAPTPKTVRRSGVSDIGKRGWFVSSGFANLLGAGIIDGLPLALVGTVPGLVSADSGAVAVGDALTTGTAGRAVKRNSALQSIIGYAMEVVNSGAKTISVMVGP